jgi:hypothetical protein
MSCALFERNKMNTQQTRVFVLFYAGHSRQHIADLCGVHVNKINYILDKYGDEFVNFHLKKDVLHLIHNSLKLNKSIRQIASESKLTQPVIRYIIKRLPAELTVTPKLKKEDERLTLRCTNCQQVFNTSLFELDHNNPKRLCPDCLNVNSASK